MEGISLRTAKEGLIDAEVSVTSLQSAGNLKHFVPAWQRITNDSNILKIISGFCLDFVDGPPQFNSTRTSECKDKAYVSAEINKLLMKGVITQAVRQKGDFISPIFLRPKSNGSHRVILNLKQLNYYITYRHFKMDTLHHCLSLITPGCFMASLDLTDAYYAVPVASCCQKYLKFYAGDNLYQYTCLPNGLASGPRLFTKIMKPVFAHLRKQGFVSSGYLDDTYLQGTSFSECQSNVAETSRLLTSLGFTINEAKSVRIPTQQLCHLGFILNSVSMTVNLGPDKIDRIKLLGQQFIGNKSHTIRQVAQLIGTLVSCFPGMEYGPLYYRHLETEKSLALKQNLGNFEARMNLSSLAQSEVQWWIGNAGVCPKRLRHGNADIVLQTDASSAGWGAKLIGGKATGGRWSETEQNEHINILELKACLLGLQALCSSHCGAHIQIQTDNTTAVCYIRDMGGSQSRSANHFAHRIWNWAIAKNVWLSSTHIPGSQNVIADRASRVFNDRTEWKLDSNAFRYCIELWGEPTIDLFASRLNHQLPSYVSWQPDPAAAAVDAFSLDWGNQFVYLFPPFSLIPRVLEKLQENKGRAIMIVPQWPTQTWFPVLHRLLKDTPLLLPRSRTLLTLPGRPDVVHLLYPKIRLLACLLSAKD